MAGAAESRGGAAGLATALAGAFVLGGVGPVVAPFLPAGPARLLEPAPAALGVASILALFPLVVWPWLLRDRSPSTVVGSSAVLLLAGTPLLVGPALVGGVPSGAVLEAVAVVAVCVATGAAFAAGPGRRGRGAGLFVAAAAAFAGAAPLVNYAVNEFLRVSGEIGYRLSPPLALRRILLSRPDADPAPLLLAGLAATALLLVPRMLRGATALVLLAAVLPASAQPAPRNLLGDSWVPGRPVPLLLGDPDSRGIELPGVGRFLAVAEGGLAEVFVPGPAAPDARIPGQPVPDGRPLVLCLAPPGEDFVAAARDAGAVLSLADPVVRATPERCRRLGILVDAVHDPAGALDARTVSLLEGAGVPVISGADLSPLSRARGMLRRPWQEPGRILSDFELRRVFPPERPEGSGRALTSLAILAGFLVAAAAVARFVRAKGAGLPLLAAALAAPAAGCLVCLAVGLPPPPGAKVQSFFASEGLRRARLVLVTARRDTEFRRVEISPPVPLTRGPFTVTSSRAGSFEVRFPLRRGETRLYAVDEVFEPASSRSPPDLLFSREGLAWPGKEPRPVADFLREEMRLPNGQPDWRVFALRKFVRLADAPEGTAEIRIGTDGIRLSRE